MLPPLPKGRGIRIDILMNDITYRDRATGKLKKEKIYGKFFLETLYGNNIFSRLLLLPLFAHIPFFSKQYGKRQKRKKSRTKIIPFIRDFHVDVSEFADPIESFNSFNDFFIRKLKPKARPIKKGSDMVVFPADGRHLVFPNLEKVEGFYVKGQKFNLRSLLDNEELVEKYREGSMVISRLCPTDYHRYHFPCSGTPGKAKLINGPLFSVNPIALRKHFSILSENKRVITPVETTSFGTLLYIEVGATCVGSIQQTYTPEKPCKKGDEKGYFEFGGSCVILLFEPSKIIFDQDLVETSAQYIETYAKMGTSMGKKML
ncbi:phosphatidylserine decarboxylase [Candidatus Neptunochlamydia vexilliferae]|uniref:Phosphatidylserine decarboxylase proenzyme n=1 Tax=Candidatus Neptunichlamydia vexilliferae TaxID=1651774 RepID=A0ABS0B1B6_9BACT|nr:phosphatidylserine decarboxylase [Candidatus Neptunochlamydia vexilliferae]MBF5060179.1 Phosphatidylserine decarboxylase proenzyme [Candidatus Neptunochlamydia vexilliferae]